jgi:hypothetical protein
MDLSLTGYFLFMIAITAMLMHNIYEQSKKDKDNDIR